MIRLYETLLGRAGFRRGMDLYFERFDGQAVTCDDFRNAMADANDAVTVAAAASDPKTVAGAAEMLRSAPFERWYSQAGTPTLTVQEAKMLTAAEEAAANGSSSGSGSGSSSGGSRVALYALTLSQSTAPTAGQADKGPLLIPVAMGFLDAATGAPLKAKLKEEEEGAASFEETVVLTLSEERQSFLLAVQLPSSPPPSTSLSSGEENAPVLSLLRGFSAPVRLEWGGSSGGSGGGAVQSSGDLSVILKHDPDAFSRYEAMARLAINTLTAMASSASAADGSGSGSGSSSSSSSDPAAKRMKGADGAATAASSASGADGKKEEEDAIAAPFVAAWLAVLGTAESFAAAGQQHLMALMLALPPTVELLNDLPPDAPMDAAAAAAARKRLGQRLATAAG